MLVTLAVTEGPHKGRTFSFRDHDTFIVGRASYTHFRLEAKDRYFSRAHFLVEVNPPLCRLIDMGSTNGTFVNDQKVGEIDLKNGDQIRGGKTLLTVSVVSEGTDEETIDLSEMAMSLEAMQSLACLGADTTHFAGDGRHGAAGDTSGSDETLGQLGPYQLQSVIGQGDMGITYRAVRDSDRKTVALKTISPKVPVTRSEVERFVREAGALLALEHPGLLSFLEVGESEGLPYIVKEYVDGDNLDEALYRSGPFPVEPAVAMTCSLLKTLEYAHRRGHVHRDIKPGNLIHFKRAGVDGLKLSDFGLAHVYQESKLSGLRFQGQMGGAIAFSAPERITHFRESRTASDLYSAGAALYMLLTGCYVYDFSEALNRQMLSVLQEDPVPVRSRRPALAQGLADVVHRALARNPEDRFADAESMRRALRPFAGKSSPCGD